MLKLNVALQARPLRAKDCLGNLWNMISLYMHFAAYRLFYEQKGKACFA